MRLVYVAGPFRGVTPWNVEQNVRRAEGLGREVGALGAVPVIPHSMYRYFDKQFTDEFWLQGTLEILRKCDAVILVPGWEASVGSIGEEAEAVRLHIPVFETLPNLQAWLENPAVGWTLCRNFRKFQANVVGVA